MSKSPSPQEIAEACGARLLERDRLPGTLGISLEEIGPGHARMRMTVGPDMINSHGTCHGGMIFALADCAFSYSCNARNRKTVAAACSIDYVKPAQAGDVLTATAQEQSLTGRSGIYDITVTDQSGALVAHFRGRSLRVSGKNVEELDHEK